MSSVVRALCRRQGASLSPEMALRIEKAFGPKMDTLLRMQTAYDTAKARHRADEIKVKRYIPASARVRAHSAR